MSAGQYTTVKVVGTILSIFNRLCKSIAFNILVLIIGFGFGYVYNASKVHYYTMKHDHITYVEEFESKIRELAIMDIEYTKKQNEALELMEQYKQKLSHDVHHECETTLGSKIYNN